MIFLKRSYKALQVGGAMSVFNDAFAIKTVSVSSNFRCVIPYSARCALTSHTLWRSTVSRESLKRIRFTRVHFGAAGTLVLVLTFPSVAACTTLMLGAVDRTFRGFALDCMFPAAWSRFRCRFLGSGIPVFVPFCP